MMHVGCEKRALYTRSIHALFVPRLDGEVGEYHNLRVVHLPCNYSAPGREGRGVDLGVALADIKATVTTGISFHYVWLSIP